MKINLDDQEQIGIAAIDLFASGMGAFILIAIIFMVLFAATPKQSQPTEPKDCPDPVVPDCPECPPPIECPEVTIPDCPECPEIPEKECPECPEVPEPAIPDCPPVPEPDCPDTPDCPLCPICEDVDTTVESEEPAAAPVERLACPEPEHKVSLLPETDIVFVLDTTNSMTLEIEALKRELYVVVDVLERMMPSVGIGVVTFNDRFQSPVIRHHPLRQLTNNPDNLNDLQRFLRTISIHNARGRNPDIPEAILTALKQAVSTSFRPNIENRIVIVITDSFAYPEDQTATYRLARQFSQEKGHRVSVVFVRAYPESEKYLQQLADAGNGLLVADRGSILGNVLLGMLPEKQD